MISSHHVATILVFFRLVSFTIPLNSPNSTKSQILNGFEISIENDENKSLSMFCNANAIAIQPIHRLAISGVISTQIFIRMRRIHIIQISIFASNFNQL